SAPSFFGPNGRRNKTARGRPCDAGCPERALWRRAESNGRLSGGIGRRKRFENPWKFGQGQVGIVAHTMRGETIEIDCLLTAGTGRDDRAVRLTRWRRFMNAQMAGDRLKHLAQGRHISGLS